MILKCRRRRQTLRKHRKSLNQLQLLQATFRHRHILNYTVIFSSTESSGMWKQVWSAYELVTRLRQQNDEYCVAMALPKTAA